MNISKSDLIRYALIGLQAEREKVDQRIRELHGVLNPPPPAAPNVLAKPQVLVMPKKREWTPEQRKRASARMKRFWRKKRA